MSRPALVGLGLVLAVAAIAAGVGLELGVGWGLAAGGVLSGAALLFLVDLDDDSPDGGDA
ncbi:hypothetical protein [Nocardiopsis ganjiahuensis]|uniref:hypothetical protein n=1 Tax=Nocardiopsis ganjiahuensis TaxID=239984 RepID=UPI00036B29D6|nr:hypothetical protein [Nocardiopsis ganjiahuensis]